MLILLESAAIFFYLSVTVGAKPRVIVDIDEPSVGDLRHFWDSTGLWYGAYT
jgi:hypothetical protein